MTVEALLVGGCAALLAWLTALGCWGLWTTNFIAGQLTPQRWVELKARLNGLPRAFRSYACWKLRLDPIYAFALAELPSEGELVDLGTGIGLLPVLLGLTRPLLKIRGVEWDPRKARLARQLVDGMPWVSIEEMDAHTYSLGVPSAIALLDILHYRIASDSQGWISRCARALGPGGVLLIRELEPSRWAIAVWLERLAVRGKWNRGGGVHARPSTEIAQELRILGLQVVRRQAGAGLFQANTLTIARRPLEIHGN